MTERKIIKQKNVALVILDRKISDTEIIKSSIATIMADKKLLKKTLIASGVYNKDLKLTKAYL